MSYTIQVSAQQLRHINRALQSLAQNEHQTEKDEFGNNVNISLVICVNDTLGLAEDSTIHGFCL